jgi:hypothetical protein
MTLDSNVGDAIGGTGRADFSVGHVISQTLTVVKQNLGVFAPLALLAALPQSVLLWVSATSQAGQVKGASAVANAVVVLIVSVIVSFVFSYLLQAAVVHGTFKYLNGERAGIMECLSTSLSSLFPLVGLSLLASLGILLGFALLVVPGIIFALMWFVIVPVLIVERTSIGDAFRRSSELTADYRWSLLGLVVIFACVAAGLGVAARLFVGAGAFGSPGANGIWPYIISQFLVKAAMAALGAAGVAVTYYDLRAVKEGIGPEALASVFD